MGVANDRLGVEALCAPAPAQVWNVSGVLDRAEAMDPWSPLSPLNPRGSDGPSVRL